MPPARRRCCATGCAATGVIDPGRSMPSSSCRAAPYPFNNTSGAGPIRLPERLGVVGQDTVGNGQTIDIPLGIGAEPLDAALWWPETTSQTHNDVDLLILRPSGLPGAVSASISSVYERARVTSSITTGTWKVHIQGFSIASPQTVFWAVAAHPAMIRIVLALILITGASVCPTGARLAGVADRLRGRSVVSRAKRSRA